MKIRYGLLLAFFLLVSTTVLAEEKRFQVPIDDSPRFGSVQAPVTIIEFLDFQ